jgi:ketosteroid isomerase-like protein
MKSRRFRDGSAAMKVLLSHAGRPARGAGLLFLLVSLGIFGCASSGRNSAPPSPVQAPAPRDIQTFPQAARTADVERLLRAFYEAEPIAAFVPGQKGGLEAARAAWKQMLAKARIEVVATRTESSCDLVGELGRFSLRIEAEEGDRRVEKGLYYVSWKRTGGRWQAEGHAFFPGGFEDDTAVAP